MRIQAIEKFVRGQKVALIGSVDEDGVPNIKAMLSPRQQIGLKEFYFSTNLSAIRTQQFIKNPKACVYFFNKGLIKYTGVMLRGKMEVIKDQEIKNLIWRNGDTKFYRQGVTDPDYVVLKFTATSGRFYQDLHSEELKLD